MFTDYYLSPFGFLKICADQQYIHSISLTNDTGQPPLPNSLTQLSKKFLADYFNGLNPSVDPSLFLLKGTDFQKSVWIELLKIPYGFTSSYSDIAVRIGNPKAVRAVGTAVGKNPICILIPCHRILPVSGIVGNYAYGSSMKKELLILEKKSRSL